RGAGRQHGAPGRDQRRGRFPHLRSLRGGDRRVGPRDRGGGRAGRRQHQRRRHRDCGQGSRQSLRQHASRHPAQRRPHRHPQGGELLRGRGVIGQGRDLARACGARARRRNHPSWRRGIAVTLLEWIRARPAVKWAVSAGLVVLVIGLVWGGWALWKMRYEAQGSIALTQARALAVQSQAPGASPETPQRAEQALQDVGTEYPRLSSIGQAAYLLGSLRFANGQWASARAAFETARDKASSPTLAALAALDVGYSWEAEKKYPEAEKAFQSAISSAGSKS